MENLEGGEKKCKGYEVRQLRWVGLSGLDKVWS